MANAIEYALMAGRAYEGKRYRSRIVLLEVVFKKEMDSRVKRAKLGFSPKMSLYCRGLHAEMV